jgi:hypothetical protein
VKENVISNKWSKHPPLGTRKTRKLNPKQAKGKEVGTGKNGIQNKRAIDKVNVTKTGSLKISRKLTNI